jgi:hypothetical protein
MIPAVVADAMRNHKLARVNHAHLALLYMDESTIGALPPSHLRFRLSGKELATTSCHIVGVTYGPLA